MFVLLVSILLSIGSIDALIPIILILFLVVAAAGLNRGYSLFNIFGIATLAGINPGGKNSIAGKTAFSVIVYTFTKNLGTTNIGQRTAGRITNLAKRTVGNAVKTAVVGTIATTHVLRNVPRPPRPRWAVPPHWGRGRGAVARAGAAAVSGAATAGRGAKAVARKAAVPFKKVGGWRRTHRRLRNIIGKGVKRNKNKVGVATGLLVGAVAAGPVGAVVGAAAGVAAAQAARGARAAAKAARAEKLVRGIPIRHARSMLNAKKILERSKKKNKGQGGQIFLALNPATFIAYRGYKVYKANRDNYREVKGGERFAGVRDRAQEVYDQIVATHGMPATPQQRRDLRRAIYRDITQKGGVIHQVGQGTDKPFLATKPSRTMMGAAAAATGAGIMAAAVGYGEARRNGTGKLRGAARGLGQSMRTGAEKIGTGAGERSPESSKAFIEGMSPLLGGLAQTQRRARQFFGVGGNNEHFKNPVVEKAVVDQKIHHAKFTTNSKLLQQELDRADTVIADQRNQFAINSAAIRTELNRPNPDEAAVRRLQQQNQNLQSRIDLYTGLKKAVATNGSLPSGQKGQNLDSRDDLLAWASPTGPYNKTVVARLKADDQRRKDDVEAYKANVDATEAQARDLQRRAVAARNANPALNLAAANAASAAVAARNIYLRADQLSIETAANLKQAQDAVDIRASIASQPKIPHTISDSKGASQTTQSEVRAFLNPDEHTDVKIAALKSEALTKDMDNANDNLHQVIVLARDTTDTKAASVARGFIKARLRDATYSKSAIEAEMRGMLTPAGTRLYTDAEIEQFINGLKA